MGRKTTRYARVLAQVVLVLAVWLLLVVKTATNYFSKIQILFSTFNVWKDINTIKVGDVQQFVCTVIASDEVYSRRPYN